MEGISYSGLKSMNKTEYLKQFKKPAPWRKASGVLFFAKYKFSNGKLDLVAVPFRKYADAAKCFKNEVKKDKKTPYKPMLTLLASFELAKNNKGILTAEITPMQGGMNSDYLESVGKELFSTLKMDFNVVGDQTLDVGDLVEIAKGENPYEDPVKIEKEAAEELARRKTNLARVSKIINNIPVIDAAIGKASPDKLMAKIKTFEEVLIQVEKDAAEDLNITEEEQNDINRISKSITRWKEQLANLPKDTANAPDIESDTIIDNLEASEKSETQREKEAFEIEDTNNETASLLKKNKKKVSKAVASLKKLKEKIVNAKIDADAATKELTKLQGHVAQGIGIDVDKDDSMAEIRPIIAKINKDITQLQSYVEEKLRPQLAQREVLKEELKKAMDKENKNAALLINELKDSVLSDMEAQFATFENNLSQFYKN